MSNTFKHCHTGVKTAYECIDMINKALDQMAAGDITADLLRQHITDLVLDCVERARSIGHEQAEDSMKDSMEESIREELTTNGLWLDELQTRDLLEALCIFKTSPRDAETMLRRAMGAGYDIETGQHFQRLL